MTEISINPFFGRIAVLRGAHSLAYQRGMSRSLRAVRLALHPEKLNY
jgi:hypothetical protein